MRKAAILAALFAAAICQTSPAEEAQEQLDRAQRQLAGLRKQLGQRAAALNDLGVTPQDMVAIFQAIERAGALPARLELM